MTSVGIMASGVSLPSAVDVLMEPFNNYTFAPWTLAGTPTIVSGRTGTAASIAGSVNNATYAILAPNQSDHITIGCAFRTTALAVTRKFLTFRVSGTDENLLALQLDGALAFIRSSSTVAASATGLIAINTWYYIELQFRNHPLAGWVKVRINATEVINATGLNTTFNGVPNQLFLNAVAGLTHLYDDLYLTMGAGAAFKGSITVP